jgi:hypothetical protein
MEKKSAMNNYQGLDNSVDKNSALEKAFQLKKRKTVTSYFGAGYSFMIFTNAYMSAPYPVFDTRNGTFLTNISIFFGFAVAKAVTLEIEPAILFTSSEKQINYPLSVRYNGSRYAHTSTNSIIALPVVLNVRFFPLFKQKGFSRLIFLGGGVGMEWISEDNDVFFNDNPTTINFSGSDSFIAGLTSSQWAPVFRMMAGVTGTGGQFGFGGEVRYNIIPLEQDMSLPFATRFASDFNSVDISLRFYFSL